MVEISVGVLYFSFWAIQGFGLMNRNFSDKRSYLLNVKEILKKREKKQKVNGRWMRP